MGKSLVYKVEEYKEDEVVEDLEEDENDDKEEQYEVEQETDQEDDAPSFQTSKGFERGSTRKVKALPDHCGAELFKTGRATRPKNPYFVTQIRPKRRDQLYIPVDVVSDYNLKLRPTMLIRDFDGREFPSQLKKWGDGRIWLVGGWARFCRINLVDKQDKCICEFILGKGKKVLYLQVHIVRQGSASHP